MRQSWISEPCPVCKRVVKVSRLQRIVSRHRDTIGVPCRMSGKHLPDQFEAAS